jgi:hypothetical protein
MVGSKVKITRVPSRTVKTVAATSSVFSHNRVVSRSA